MCISVQNTINTPTTFNPREHSKVRRGRKWGHQKDILVFIAKAHILFFQRQDCSIKYIDKIELLINFFNEFALEKIP